MNLPIIGRLFSNSSQASYNNRKSTYSQKPSPEEVLQSSLPLKRFEGLKVAWDLTFQYIHYQISRKEVLVLTTLEQQPGNIWLVVDVEQNPEIYYYARGDQLSVKGEIDLPQGGDIYLKGCQLKFPDEGQPDQGNIQ